MGEEASQAAPATGPAFCGPEPPSRVPQAAQHSWEQASLPELLTGPGVLQTVGVQWAQLALGAPRPPCSTVRRLKGLVRVSAPLRAFRVGLSLLSTGSSPQQRRGLAQGSLVLTHAGSLGVWTQGLSPLSHSEVLRPCSQGRGRWARAPQTSSPSTPGLLQTLDMERSSAPPPGPHPSKPRPLPSLTAPRATHTAPFREATHLCLFPGVPAA